MCCGYTGEVSSRSCGTKQALTRPEEETLLEQEESSADVAPRTAGENDICTTISVLPSALSSPLYAGCWKLGGVTKLRDNQGTWALQPEKETW